MDQDSRGKNGSYLPPLPRPEYLLPAPSWLPKPFPQHLHQRMDDVLGMQGDIGPTQGCAVDSVKGSVPLLVFVTETHHHQVALLNQGSSADGVDLRCCVIASKGHIFRPQMVARCVAGIVTGYRRGGDYIQPLGRGTAPDLVAPIGGDFAGKINVKRHGAPNAKGSTIPEAAGKKQLQAVPLLITDFNSSLGSTHAEELNETVPHSAPPEAEPREQML